MLAAILTFYAVVPNRLYRQTNLRPDITPRWATYLRVTYLTVLLSGLALLTHVPGKPWGWYYVLLWLVTMVTSFSFFMIMRQVVQHGNAGQGRYTNTRIFLVSRFIRFAVFPLGMDYHLPHHLFPMVPTTISAAARLLLETEEYRERHGGGGIFSTSAAGARDGVELMGGDSLDAGLKRQPTVGSTAARWRVNRDVGSPGSANRPCHPVRRKPGGDISAVLTRNGS